MEDIKFKRDYIEINGLQYKCSYLPNINSSIKNRDSIDISNKDYKVGFPKDIKTTYYKGDKQYFEVVNALILSFEKMIEEDTKKIAKRNKKGYVRTPQSSYKYSDAEDKKDLEKLKKVLTHYKYLLNNSNFTLFGDKTMAKRKAKKHTTAKKVAVYGIEYNNGHKKVDLVTTSKTKIEKRVASALRKKGTKITIAKTEMLRTYKGGKGNLIKRAKSSLKPKGF